MSDAVYHISRDISSQPSLRVLHDGPPPCLYCGEPVLHPSTAGPLICGPCDCNGGAILLGKADGGWDTHGTPRITHRHQAHFRHCVDHIIATQPDGRYPPDAGPEWVARGDR